MDSPPWLVGRRLFQPALGAQAPPDALNLDLAFLQGAHAGVDGVIAQYQIMRMLDGGADDESRVAPGDEFQCFVRLFEHDELACRNRFGAIDLPIVNKCPRDVVAARRLVTPALALLKFHMQIVDRQWR